ncbi:AIPR family protein [Pseudomonas sp. GX19020]|uniref:AIPR family protein n=1 Tax=Pseudomonas sp. GX19020 TaxID=2942277 RepID=UPI002019BC6A|nr:AIPR family protein [Pseudomonas sp. GX19020]MCL4065801.1 AIPR family protein [Pseudomonas sp. GX19020]
MNWEKPFNQLKEDNDLSRDSIGVFAINLKFGLDDFQAIASEAITGGGDDKKCDILYVDKEKQVAVIAQCYLANAIKVAAPANKASDLNTAITWLLNTDMDHLPEGLRGRADELRSAIQEGEIRQLHIWYVHNCPASKNVKNELIGVEASARKALKHIQGGDDISVFSEEVCRDTLEKLYNQAERTIIVTDKIETYVPDAFEIHSDEWSALSTVVKGAWLRRLYKKHTTDLFSANLRGYLGSRQSDSNINNGIKETADTEPENFYVYNNGITAIVLGYSLGRKTKSGKKLTIEGISIVNGAQTTGSISSLSDDVSSDLQVPIRFVKAKTDAIVSHVVQFNNTQNKIQAADFRSNDPIQDRLRHEFKAVPNAEYEGGRRGGASDVIKRSKYTLPSYTVGQALAAFHGDPVTAYDKKSELWTNEKYYRHIFTDRTSARHIVFCYSLLSLVNSRKLELQQKQRNAGLTEVEERSIKFLNKKGSAYLVLWVASQCMETILGKAIPNKFDIHFKKNISPSDATKEWLPIFDLIMSLSGQLDSAFSRSRISNDAVGKSVPNFVGVIDSLKEIHKPTFDKFASSVDVKHK